jgi:hypothetical protein
MARLLAKGWVVFCLYAGGHALVLALQRGAEPLRAAEMIGVCGLLFLAMGLLFVGGYAIATDHGHAPRGIAAGRLLPGFNEIVFAAFAAASFVNQNWLAPLFLQSPVADAIRSAIFFAVPGQRALEDTLTPLGLDGGRFFASAFAWLLAIIFVGSAASRLRLSAGLIRLERAKRPEALGDATLALLQGVLAVGGIQLLYVGTAYAMLPESIYTEVAGAILIGLAPLMLAYLIVVACANLLATGPE